jgi:hypothetical protein
MRAYVLITTLILALSSVMRVNAQLSPDTDFLKSSPAAQGTIRQYLIDPRGEVQGLLLSDGAQVAFTSRLQSDVVTMMKPGTPVRIEGRRHKQFPLVEPDTMINTDSGAAIKVPSLLEGPLPLEKETLSVQQMHAEGEIDRLLYERSGRVSGLVLQNGTQVWLPPDINDSFRKALRIGDRLVVEGNGTDNKYGRAMEPIAMGFQGGPLTPLDHTIDRLEKPSSQHTVQ